MLLAWGPAVAWMLVIFAASSRPRIPHQDDVPDWLSHTAAYLVLSLFACRAVGEGGPLAWRPAGLVFVFCVAYGISDEWHQSFVPGRHADPWDVLKDGVGSLLGIAVHRVWGRGPAAGEAVS